jgi:hypothetical protein
MLIPAIILKSKPFSRFPSQLFQWHLVLWNKTRGNSCLNAVQVEWMLTITIILAIVTDGNVLWSVRGVCPRARTCACVCFLNS